MGGGKNKGIPWVILLLDFPKQGLPEVYLDIHIKPIARSIASESDTEIVDSSAFDSDSMYATTGAELPMLSLLCPTTPLAVSLPPDIHRSTSFSKK